MQTTSISLLNSVSYRLPFLPVIWLLDTPETAANAHRFINESDDFKQVSFCVPRYSAIVLQKSLETIHEKVSFKDFIFLFSYWKLFTWFNLVTV